MKGVLFFFLYWFILKVVSMVRDVGESERRWEGVREGKVFGTVEMFKSGG